MQGDSGQQLNSEYFVHVGMAGGDLPGLTDAVLHVKWPVATCPRLSEAPMVRSVEPEPKPDTSLFSN